MLYDRFLFLYLFNKTEETCKFPLADLTDKIHGTVMRKIDERAITQPYHQCPHHQ